MTNRIQVFLDTFLISSVQFILVIAYMVVKILNFIWGLTRVGGNTIKKELSEKS